MKYFQRYLPLSDEMRQRGFYVIAGGYTLIAPHTSYPPSIHPSDHDFRWQAGRTLQEYQIVYITRGSGNFESRSGGKQRIEPGTLFALLPGEWHRYSPDPDTGWDEYWVAFQGEFAAQALGECNITATNPVAKIGINDQLVAEYMGIVEELREESAGHQHIIAARTHLIMALASALALRRNFEGTEVGYVIERAKCLMMERIDQPLNMENLADNLNVGYSWFRRMFRQYTGLSPAQYHLQLRLNRARELLGTTTLSIASISQKLGFESPEYFARIFKAKTGCSPRRYRTLTEVQTR